METSLLELIKYMGIEILTFTQVSHLKCEYEIIKNTPRSSNSGQKRSKLMDYNEISSDFLLHFEFSTNLTKFPFFFDKKVLISSRGMIFTKTSSSNNQTSSLYPNHIVLPYFHTNRKLIPKN